MKLHSSRKISKKSRIFVDGTIDPFSKPQVPSYIFHDRMLTPLEAIIKYLRERKKLSYNAISILLSRDVRDVYKAYAHSFDKTQGIFRIRSDYSRQIPISIFSNRKISVLEALVLYLKDRKNLSFKQISQLLNRDQRTVWTVYQRAIKKNDR